MMKQNQNLNYITKLLVMLILNISSKHVRFINYHKVYDYDGTGTKLGISSKILRLQIEWLLLLGFRFISLAEALRDYSNKKSLKKTIVFTTDDAFIDNVNTITQVFNEYGIKPTIFINSNTIGNKGIMTVEQIKSLISKGYEIGSHTCNHSKCLNMTAPDIEIEIAKDIIKLKQIFHQDIVYFAFPHGLVFKNYNLLKELKDLGLKVALSTKYYINNNQNPLCWGRDKGEMPFKKFKFNFIFRSFVLFFVNKIKPFDKRYLFFK